MRFLELIKKNFPELVGKYENLYGEQESPPRDYILRLNRSAFEFCKKYGIKNYIPPPSFERYSKQRTLIPTANQTRDNFEIVNHLLLLAFFKEFKSADPYSAWAYHKASNAIENLDKSIRDIYSRGKLRDIPCVGDTIAKVVEDFLVTGRRAGFDNKGQEKIH